MNLSISDISKCFPNAIKLLLHGEEIIITKNKKPIAKLVSIEKENNISKFMKISMRLSTTFQIICHEIFIRYTYISLVY